MPEASTDRPTITRLTLAVPPSLAADFKRACSAHDESMSQAMRRFMRAYIRADDGAAEAAIPGQLELDRAAA
jgi:hypothetical protein